MWGRPAHPAETMIAETVKSFPMEGAGEDKRRYIRLSTVFPIEFQFVDKDKEPTSPVFQGVARNVGKGGICIEAKAISGKDVLDFIPGKTRLKLTINIPSSIVATETYGTVSWVEETSFYTLKTYIFGVEYDEIETKNQRMIYLYVLWLYKKPKLVVLFFILLLMIVALLVYLGVKPI